MWPHEGGAQSLGNTKPEPFVRLRASLYFLDTV